MAARRGRAHTKMPDEAAVPDDEISAQPGPPHQEFEPAPESSAASAPYPPPGYPPPGYPPPYPPPAYQQTGYPPPGYAPPGHPPPGYGAPAYGHPGYSQYQQGGYPGYGPPGYPPPGYQYPPYGVRPGPVDVLGRPMAEWWRRLLAYLIDALVLGVPWAIIIATVTNTSSTNNTNSSFSTMNFTRGTWIGFGIGIIVMIGYFTFCDGSSRGQTLGKLVLDISVRDMRTGGPIGAGRALLRRVFFFAMYFAFLFPFVLDALWPLWDPQRQSLHDKVVGSCVVRVR